MTEAQQLAERKLNATCVAGRCCVGVALGDRWTMIEFKIGQYVNYHPTNQFKRLHIGLGRLLGHRKARRVKADVFVAAHGPCPFLPRVNGSI